jgi:DNA-binding NarL/FixJ family response regulator
VFGEEVDDQPPGPDDPVRVLICDEHDLVRRSLTASLEEGPTLEVVAEAADGTEAVTESRHLAPDVAFVSLLLPELTGVQTIGLIADVMPGIDVVALAVEEPVEERFDALRAGACSVMDKEEVVAAPGAAVERLLEGAPAVAADLAGMLLDRFDDLVGSSARVVLDGRERAVLERLQAGDDEKAIADRLGMLGGEMRNHVLNVLRRLQVAAPLDPDESALEVLAAVGA